MGPDAEEGPGSVPAEAGLLRVPGYELLSELGRGGVGVVYKARQESLGRVVALKMILAGGHASEADLARFRSEAEAIARLQHPNIVQVHEVGEQDGRPFFSLEFCAGGSLEQRRAGRPLPPDEAARMVETLARAMHAAHEEGVIHRDLKPANVLLASSGRPGSGAGGEPPAGWPLHDCIPKIGDFGLAKRLDLAGQTATGAVLGTPSYMAPEQAAGKSREIDARTDVYALGAILYECLTGRPPFRAATALDTLLQVAADDPVPPSRLQPNTPRDLETICLKCLQKEPRKRYPDAGDLAEDLARFGRHQPIRARPVGRAERALKWVKRRPATAALLGVSGVALLALLLGGLFFTARLQGERNRAIHQEEEAREEKTRAEFQLDRARRHLMTAQLLRAAALCRREPWQAARLLDDVEACPPDLRDFAWGITAASAGTSG
jgi:serine/threonine protein kinase